MATAPLNFPKLFNNGTRPWSTVLPAVTDGSNTFVGGQIVKISSGALAAYVADDTLIYGLTQDSSTTSTTEPYLSPNGDLHSPIALSGQVLIMNITDGSGTVGSGSTTQADVTIGTLYSGHYLGTVNTSILGLDASDSGTATKNIFRVVGFYNTTLAADGDASTTYNGRVLVQVIPTALQSA